MNREELVIVLTGMAKADLADDSDLYDHPCSVAIRALDKCFDDINTLRMQVERHSSQSKKVQHLVGLRYNPEW